MKRRFDAVTRVGQVFAVLAAIVTVAPLPVALAVALSDDWRFGPLGGLTLDWFARAWESTAPNVFVSLRVAAIVLVVDLLIGFPAAWLIARHRFPGRRLLMALTTAPIAIPGIAVGLGLILAYPTIRPTGWLMTGGHVLYTLPFLLSTLVPALAQRGLIEQEEVAASLGAGPVRRLWGVTVPTVRGALLAAVLMVVTLSIGEFNVSFFLFTPLQQPLPVVLYDSFITGRLESAAAATLIFLALVIPAVVVLERMGGAKIGGA